MITKNEIEILDSLDFIICKYCKFHSDGLLSGSAGASIYFMNRYFNTSNGNCLEMSLQILEKQIASINDPQPESYFGIGYNTSSPCWVIDQFIKLDVLDENERVNSNEWIRLAIESTTEEEIIINRHDLFYGFIGKALLIMEHDQDHALPFLTEIIKALKKNAIKDLYGIHWESPFPFHGTIGFERTINLGIPHGSCGIILFLLKCCDAYSLHNDLKSLLNGSVEWLINLLEKENNKVLYSYSSKPSATGKLGWCYGDQAIAYTLLRYSESFICEKAKAKAYELIEQAAAKPIEQTGVQYYPKYGYYDMRVCHGTSSVAYMWLKMYHITKDENIKTLADKWLNITLDNLNIFLPQLDKIREIEKGNDKIDTSMGFLNGLSGVGLVLMSFLDPKLSDWDKLLLLDRPGRE